MKTNELTGAALDWAVNQADEESEEASIDDGTLVLFRADSDGGSVLYAPSTDWSQGGPIIEREKISVIEGTNDEWQAGKRPYKFYYGSTPLIAAMRCYVASRLGDEVEVPNGLL